MEDPNPHGKPCHCEVDKRFQSMLADTPKSCRGACCANPRRKSKWTNGEVTIQEQKALESYRSYGADLLRGSSVEEYHPPKVKVVSSNLTRVTKPWMTRQYQDGV